MHWQFFVLIAVAAIHFNGGYAASVLEINKWADDLQKGIVPKSVSITRPNELRDLISKSYVSAETSVRPLLEFARNFPAAYLKVTGYGAVYDAMNKTGDTLKSAEIFVLASFIRDVESSRTRYNKLEGAWRRRLAALKAKLPPVVREIVFRSYKGHKCTIKNKRFATYLSAADDDDDGIKYEDETRRRVFVGTIPTWRKVSPQQWWNFESAQNGEFWMIRSPHFRREFLHAFLGVEGQFDKDRRRTGTAYSLKLGGVWKLKPENGGKHVSILNGKTSEYMYAAMSDTELDYSRRAVYTWIPKPHDASIDDQSQWEVQCPGK